MTHFHNIAPCKGILIPKSEKFLLVESGILVFGIGNTAQLIRVPLTVGNRNLSSAENESIIQHLESGIHGMESRIQDCLEFPYTERTTAQAVKNIKKNASVRY